MAASPPLALLCGGMYVICRFQLHILAAPGSAVFYSFYSFNEHGANRSPRITASLRVYVCGCRCKVQTQSEGEEVECPLFQDLFLWVLSSLSGRGFSDLYARFVYFCLPGYSGWCVSLTHTPHIPHPFLVISTLFALPLVMLLPSLTCQMFFSIYSLSSFPFSS